MSKYWYMTDDERTEHFKYLLRYGKIIRDNEVGNWRVRIIEYNHKKYRHIMENGKCIHVTEIY